MLIHRCFGTDLQLAFVIRSSGVSLQCKVFPGMFNKIIVLLKSVDMDPIADPATNPCFGSSSKSV